MFGAEQLFQFLPQRCELICKQSGLGVGQQSLRDQQRHKLRRAEPESREFEGYRGGIAITLPAERFNWGAVATLFPDHALRCCG